MLWGELALPLIGLILTAYHASREADNHQSVVMTAGRTNGRVYLERFSLLLRGLSVLNFMINLLIARAFKIEPGGLVAVKNCLFSLPVLLFFTALTVKSTNWLKSAPDGVAVAGGIWLLWVLLAVLSRHPLWEPIYPFLGFFHPSSKSFLLNRGLLFVSGLLSLLPQIDWTFQFRFSYRTKFLINVLFLLPVTTGLAYGFINGG